MLLRMHMIRLLFLIVFILSGLVSICSAAAKESPVSVKAQVNKSTITIGDPVEYTVTIRRKASISVISHLEAPAEDVFKVSKIDDIKQQEGDMVIEGKKFTLTAFRLGEFVLDPVSVEYKDDKGDVKVLGTDPIYIIIKSVAEGENKTDIRGIKPVFSMPASRLIWYLVSGAVLAAVILLGVRSYWLRRMKLAMSPVKPILSPEDQALNDLSTLFDSDLLKRGKIKEYYLKLSEIIRTYFERRLEVPAIEATTAEIMKLLKNKETPLETRNQISEVLEAADLAKFAKWKPEPAQIIQINQKAKQIIEICRPKVEEPVHDV
jgi:hypothetical protein